MSSDDKTTRRRVWQLAGLTAVGLGVNTIFDGLAWQDARNSPQPQSSGGRQISRGTYNRRELSEIEACLNEGSRDLRGVTQYLDELLDEENGDTLTEIEYVFDESGSPEDVGSSFRYSVQLENGDEHIMGWYDAENSVIGHLAEASKYEDSSAYAEEKCI